MSRSFVLTIVFPAAAIVCVASGCQQCKVCDDPLTENEKTLRKLDASGKAPQEHWNDMADNAMLHDMTVADFHFVPHSGEISGTGAARLDRMATLLDAYGGTVRYETFEPDEALVKKRLEHVKEYLTTTGCDMKRVDIKAMISGGRGINANKAIMVDIKGTGKEASGKTKTIGAPVMVGGGK